MARSGKQRRSVYARARAHACVCMSIYLYVYVCVCAFKMALIENPAFSAPFQPQKNFLRTLRHSTLPPRTPCGKLFVVFSLRGTEGYTTSLFLLSGFYASAYHAASASLYRFILKSGT